VAAGKTHSGNNESIIKNSSSMVASTR
jgi:hypothetical protein